MIPGIRFTPLGKALVFWFCGFGLGEPAVREDMYITIALIALFISNKSAPSRAVFTIEQRSRVSPPCC
jgi:hypothetical protein